MTGSVLPRTRQELPLLLPSDSIVVELGVARGEFSEQLLQSDRILMLYSIDIWADRGHDDLEYKQAVNRLSPYANRNVIIRKRFADAVSSFADSFFDLVYIDGYAHEGQDNGKTLTDWWPKVRRGGYLAGHDYDPKFPLTVAVVDAFSREHDLPLFVVPAESGNYKFPSWYVRKP